MLFSPITSFLCSQLVKSASPAPTQGYVCSCKDGSSNLGLSQLLGKLGFLFFIVQVETFFISLACMALRFLGEGLRGLKGHRLSYILLEWVAKLCINGKDYYKRYQPGLGFGLAAWPGPDRGLDWNDRKGRVGVFLFPTK